MEEGGGGRGGDVDQGLLTDLVPSASLGVKGPFSDSRLRLRAGVLFCLYIYSSRVGFPVEVEVVADC